MFKEYSLKYRIYRLRGKYPDRGYPLTGQFSSKSSYKSHGFSSIQLARWMQKIPHGEILEALHELRELGVCRIMNNRWYWIEEEGEKE